MNTHRGRNQPEGLPLWATIVVVFWCMAMASYSVFVFGVDGYPYVMIFMGVLGAYAGIDRLVRRTRQEESLGGDGQ